MVVKLAASFGRSHGQVSGFMQQVARIGECGFIDEQIAVADVHAIKKSGLL